jgi:DNA repair photolyase
LKELFTDWLNTHHPLKATKFLGRIEEMHGGRLYDPRFSTRMRGEGPHADLLSQRFHVACRRLGLNERDLRLDTSKFRVPPHAGEQMGLFRE